MHVQNYVLRDNWVKDRNKTVPENFVAKYDSEKNELLFMTEDETDVWAKFTDPMEITDFIGRVE